jgi:hypothetical protein
MNPKLQDTLHWILVIVLWVMSIAPTVAGLISSQLSGQDLVIAISGTLVAVVTKFVYYADNTQGTTQPTTPSA